MRVKLTWCEPTEVVAATYEPVGEDACHFFVRSHVTGRTYRVPHRNVYVMNFTGEPQDHKNLISRYVNRSEDE
jgi:hypothetical protein